MTQLDKVIENKLLRDIENLLDPFLELESPRKDITDRTYFLKISLDFLPIIAREITNNKEFRNNIHKIKLDYYKRNLALLEILWGKQNISDNSRLAFKIVRENLSLKNISSYIDIYNLYYTYRTKQIIRQRPKEFILYEPEEYYQIYKLISSLNLE